MCRWRARSREGSGWFSSVVLARGAREGEGDRRRSAARPNLAAAPISPLPAPPPLARPLAVSDFFVSRGCKLVKTVMHAPASLEQGHYSKGLASVFFADRASLLLALESSGLTLKARTLDVRLPHMHDSPSRGEPPPKLAVEGRDM